ncbi:hypothetical protein ACFLY8_01805 [Halobacteriota archaeon]
MANKEERLKPSTFTTARYKSNILSAKPKLKILILGPYIPPSAKSQLKELRNFLKNKGYTQTKLVEDIPNKAVFHEEGKINLFTKSIFCINSADVNYFIFLNNGRNEGVTAELTYTCNNLQNKLNTCAVFIEKKYKKTLSTMIRDQISLREKKLRQASFQNNKELHDIALGYSLECLKLSYQNIVD